jgi:hypothetical protein
VPCALPSSPSRAATWQAISELVTAEKLNLVTKMLPVNELSQKALMEGLSSHKATPSEFGNYRERTVLQFGDESTANEMYFELQAAIRKIAAEAGMVDDTPVGGPNVEAAPVAPLPTKAPGNKLKASERWADSAALLAELKLEQYIPQFEEEEMTSIELLEEIVSRGDGEKELMDALKEMGIKKMGHRQCANPPHARTAASRTALFTARWWSGGGCADGCVSRACAGRSSAPSSASSEVFCESRVMERECVGREWKACDSMVACVRGRVT